MLGASLSLTNKLQMACALKAERRWVMTGGLFLMSHSCLINDCLRCTCIQAALHIQDHVKVHDRPFPFSHVKMDMPQPPKQFVHNMTDPCLPCSSRICLRWGMSDIICNISSLHDAWLVSGTPVPQGPQAATVSHLQPLLAFLHHQPYGVKRHTWEVHLFSMHWSLYGMLSYSHFQKMSCNQGKFVQQVLIGETPKHTKGLAADKHRHQFLIKDVKTTEDEHLDLAQIS